jgi:hypothetical protein
MLRKVKYIRIFISVILYDLEQPTAVRTDDTAERCLVTNQPTDWLLYVVESLISCEFLSQLTNSPCFMEPESLWTCSQQPNTFSWVRWIQSTPLHLVSLRSILVLFSKLCYCIQSGLFSFRFPHQTLSEFLFSSIPSAFPSNQITA